MTIPVPRVKYNLLPNGDVPQKTNQYPKTICISIILLLLLIIPLIFLFALNFFIIHHDVNEETDYYNNRAQIYSVDEYINRNSDCKSCNLPGDLRIKEPLQESRALKLVCYYNPPDALNDTTSLFVRDIPCELCTHLNVGFASIVNSSLVLSENMKNSLNEATALKTCNKRLKILLSVGGASNDNFGFPEMVRTHASRKTFIKSIKDILHSYKLDGIDLDWEFPAMGRSVDDRISNKTLLLYKRERQHFSQLLREIRSEYVRERRDYLLTVAVAAPESIVNAAYDVQEINKYVDFVNVMTYDFHFYTEYTPFTGFNAPLYSGHGEYLYFSTLNINYTANLWLGKGIDRNKIVIGLPTYGHSFTLVNINNGLPGSPASGFGKLGDRGFVNFSSTCQFMNGKYVKTEFDNDTSSPYLKKDLEWVSYEDKRSLSAKTKYIKHNEFGGAMIYSLNSDDYSGSCSPNNVAKFYLTQHVSDILFDDDL